MASVLSTPVSTNWAIWRDDAPGGKWPPWLVLYTRSNLMGSAVTLGRCTTRLMGNFFMYARRVLGLKALSASPAFTCVLSCNCATKAAVSNDAM